ncbi:hypothetical protein AAEX28_12735 [Lentisphaerota bacterium WC36G]|nr:hypothetical protein LJT99_15555 [Lentisphaerae bacterium WC36]
MEFSALFFITIGLFFVNWLVIYIASKLTNLDLTTQQIIVVSAVAAFIDPLLMIIFSMFEINDFRIIYCTSTLIFAGIFRIVSDEDFWPDLVLTTVVIRAFHIGALFLISGGLS